MRYPPQNSDADKTYRYPKSFRLGFVRQCDPDSFLARNENTPRDTCSKTAVSACSTFYKSNDQFTLYSVLSGIPLAEYSYDTNISVASLGI